MAKYKFENAHDWLDSYLTRLAEANDVAALFSEAKNLALMLDADQIQDEYQTEMDNDGYFDDEESSDDDSSDDDINVCPECGIALTAGDRHTGRCADGHALPKESWQ
jgi:hypothetical protein